MEMIENLWETTLDLWHKLPLVIQILIKIMAIILPLMVLVAYYTLLERKVIGYMQVRIGPNRVGPRGILQPIADAIKAMFKEIIIPTKSNKFLFLAAPVISLAPALAAWAVVPFGDGIVLADVDAGLLYILAISALGMYGVLISGWASNSKYALLSALRGAAQMVSYGIAMGFALIGVLMASRSMNLTDIVNAQQGGWLSWYWFWLWPMFLVYFISGVAETNRAPFDVAEGESEIVAGFHVEYSGMAFALFFLAEYAAMILISLLTSIMFFGGWLSPLQGTSLEPLLSWVPGPVWLGLKTFFFMYVYLWLRATYPRYRYDHIMRLGWKVLIPVTIVWIFVEGVMAYLHVGPWSV